MQRLVAEAEADEQHDESTVVSIFSKARRGQPPEDQRRATGGD
jgi:hypothetical protein